MADEIDAIARVGNGAPANFAQSQSGGKASVRSGAQPAGGSDDQPSTADVQAAVQRGNEHLAPVNRVLELQVDAATGLTVATIRNSATGAVLQQAPSTDSLR